MQMLKQFPLVIRYLILIFIISIGFNLAYNLGSGAEVKDKDAPASKGMKLFKSNCSGCHLNGKNLIKPDKPIIGSEKIKSKKSFGDFISSPPAPMPNFMSIAVKPEQLDALYSYVTSLMDK